MALEGMHDIYYGLQPPPNRGPIPLTHTGQRIGSPYLEVAPEKVVGIVLTDSRIATARSKRRTRTLAASPDTFWSSSPGR